MSFMRLTRANRRSVLIIAPFCLLGGAALLSGAAKDSKRSTGPKGGVKTPGILIPFSNLKADAEIPLEGSPTGFGFQIALFVANDSQNSVVRIDPKTNKITTPIAGLSKPCGGLVNAFGSLWAPNCGSQTLSRIDPKANKVTATVTAGVGSANPAIAATAESMWVLTDDKTTLSRIDPEENAIVSEIRLPAACNSIVFGEGSLWVTCPKESKVLRIDPKTNLVDKRIETASQPISIAFGDGSVWVLCKAEGKIAKIDSKTNKVAATIDLFITNADGNLAFGEGSLWATAPGFPVMRIDPQTDKVVQQFWGESGGLLQTGLDSVWLANSGKKSILKLDPKRIVATLAE